MSSIYLTGNALEAPEINMLVADQQPDWRAVAMTKLQRYGLRVVNPIVEMTSSSPHPEESGMEKSVRRALDLIDQCDALLANLSSAALGPGYGTAMEIFYAHRRGKMVTVVGHSPFNPWVLSHSQARFPNIDNALEYLIGEQPHIDPLSLALQHEAVFAERHEQLPPHGEPDYQFFGGDLPVLVLAPHASAFFREGDFQEGDAFTGCMSALIHRFARAHALHTSYCSVADPCLHLETPMVRALADIVKTGRIGLVLMLLGSPWHESHGLTLETGGPPAAGEFASRLRLTLGGLEPVADARADRQIAPLVRFISQTLGVPLLVVKTHRRYRMPKLQPEPFVQLVSLLAEFVADSGVELLRNRS
jgi:hypothetical protein